jgi:hypothetical protein
MEIFSRGNVSAASAVKVAKKMKQKKRITELSQIFTA